MSSEHFFIKKGPFPLNEIVKAIVSIKDSSQFEAIKIYGLGTLIDAKENEITFLNSVKYKEFSLKTKAAACITSENLFKFLPKNCIKINVKNVLLDLENYITITEGIKENIFNCVQGVMCLKRNLI